MFSRLCIDSPNQTGVKASDRFAKIIQNNTKHSEAENIKKPSINNSK